MDNKVINCQEGTLPKQIIGQRIFISYGHDEYSAFAIKLAGALKDNGFDVFIDLEGIRHGDQWEITIEDGLNWTKAGPNKGIFLLLMTPYSVRRPDGYCLNEIAYALDIELKIVPVMLKQVTPPLSIYRLQYFDASLDVPISDKVLQEFVSKIIGILNDSGQLDITGNFRRLEHDLNPIGFNSELKLFSQNFVGREWVFQYIHEWLKGTGKLLLVTGMPGIGKTAISTYLYQRLPNVLGFYMFRRNDNEKLSPSRFVTTLAFQIAAQIPDYRERILHMDIDNTVKQYNETSLFTRLISEPLTSITPFLHNKVIIIDGLDEAEQDGGNQIAEFISRCIPYLPNWVKVIVLSRSTSSSLLPFSEADFFEIEPDSKYNKDDLTSYIKASVDGISEEQLSLIISHSEGSFLYIKHVCLNYSVGEEELMLPKGMTSFYFKTFSEIFSSNDYVKHRKYLELILSSSRPLTKKMLKSVTNSSSYELNNFISKMGAFIRVGHDNTVKLYHTSLSDWLLNENMAGRFWIDQDEGAEELTVFIKNFIDMNLTFFHDLDSYDDENDKWSEVRKIYEPLFTAFHKKVEKVQTLIDMELDRHLFLIYIELLERNKAWEQFLSFSIWYLKSSRYSVATYELISKVINDHLPELMEEINFSQLCNVLKEKFNKKVTNLMISSRSGDPYDLTHYMALLGYYIRDLIHTEYSSEWLEILCKLLCESFPYPKTQILPSGYSHEDGICGMFADEICEKMYNIMQSGKVKDPNTLQWMKKFAHT